MLLHEALEDFASSTISSKNPSLREYADQTGTDLPISATVALPIFLSSAPPIGDVRGFRELRPETRN